MALTEAQARFLSKHLGIAVPATAEDETKVAPDGPAGADPSPAVDSGQDAGTQAQGLRDRLTRLAPALTEARHLLPDRAGQIATLEAAVTGAAENADFGAGEQALSALDAILQDAELRRKELADLTGQLQARTGTAATLRQQAVTALGEPLPREITDDLAAGERAILVGDTVDPGKIGAAIDAADDALLRVETATDRLAKEAQGWRAALSLFEGRFKELELHAEAADPAIKSGIDTLRAGLSAARNLAAAHDYPGALGALRPLDNDLLRVGNLADDCTHYKMILADRETRVGALANPSALPDVTKTLEAIRKKLGDAKALAAKTTPDYTGAVALLQPLAQEALDFDWLSKQAAKYIKLRKTLEGYIASRKTLDDLIPAKKLVATMEKLHTDSDFAVTKDYVKSVSLLERADAIDNAIYKGKTEYETFRKKMSDAEAAFVKLKKHKGADGLQNDLPRIEADLMFAVQKALASEFATATKVCEKFIGEVPALTAKADDYLAYLDAKKDYKGEVAKWDTTWQKAYAEIEAQAQKFVGEAATAFAAKDYPGATDRYAKALVYAKMVTVQIKAQQAVIKAKKDSVPLVAKADTDFEAAVRAFATMKAQVEGLDAARAFTAQIAGAQAKVDGARIFAEALMVDMVRAKEGLTAAFDDLRRIGYWATQNANYKRVLDDIESDRTSLTATDRGDALEDELDEIEDALTDADQAATAKDFAQAQAHLARARSWLVKASEKAGYYDKFKALLDGDIATIRTKIWVSEADVALNPEVDEWDQAREDAIDLCDKGDVKEAWEKLEPLKKLGEHYAEQLKLYTEAKAKEQAHVINKHGWAENRPIVAEHWRKAQEMELRLAEMYTKRQFAQAKAFTETIYWVLDAANKIYLGDAAYQPERVKAVTAIEDLKKVRCPEIEEAITAAKTALAQADKDAAARIYPNAQKAILSIPALCLGPTETGKARAEWLLALKAAEDGLAGLIKDHGGNDAVAMAAQDISARIERAKALAAAAGFKDAKAIVAPLPTEITAARAQALEQAGAETLATALTTAGAEDATGLEDQIRAARAAHGKLATHPGAKAAALWLDRADKAVTTAEQAGTGDVKAARAGLAQAGPDLALARSVAEQWLAADRVVAAALARAATLRSAITEPATLLKRLAEVDKVLALARAGADRGEGSSAVNETHSVLGELAALEQAAALWRVFEPARKKVADRITALASHKGLYSVSKTYAEARALLVEATKQAEALNLTAAQATLTRATDLLAKIELQADMAANAEVSDDKIKAVLAMKDGAKELDRILAGLDPQTKRKATKRALELRFDFKLEQYDVTYDAEGKEATQTADTDLDKAAPNILRLYGVMTGLPDRDTRDNPSMALVQRIGEGTGTSSFNGGTKVIKLRVGRAVDKLEEGIALPSELDPIDADALPKDDTPPQTFSWTTLHEIGHAVDDKLGFMDRMGSGTVYGGWKEYGADVKEVAAAAAGEFDYNQDYIESYLSNPEGKLIAPEPEGGATPEEWDRRRVAAEVWCDSIRHDKEIYYSASASSQLKIGDRVYQEAYANTWVSYLFSTRSKGVTGYQFRAPGEWFAELYAAYHTDKMNPSHPAIKWLETLGT